MLQQLTLLLGTFLIGNFTNAANLTSFNFFPPGDIKRCLSVLGDSVERFEVLPGIGWDNLENRDRSVLVSYNFSKCLTTDDGKFIIPDNVFTIPIKTSHLEIFGEMFQHWSDFTSTTATSINVETELQHSKFKISGSFSYEFEKIKKNQIADKSVTTRVQARYVRYSAKLQPDSKLSPAFQQRLRNIAFYIQKNMSRDATYESQLLVRDFGTHVVSSVDAGAIVSQVDEVKTAFTKSLDKDKSKIVAAASASFLDNFNIKGEFKTTASSELVKQYEGNRTHSIIDTFGGPIFKPHNYTLNEWTSKIETNLVAVDRVGFPIYELISLQSVPELPSVLLYSVVGHVEKAVEEYYKFNTYRGCTDIDSPDFSYMANVDDGTCSYKASNFSFGGFYQTCQQTGELKQNLCIKYVQKNPLTEGFSCPSGYLSVFLSDSQLTSFEVRKKCTSCGFLGLYTCCENYEVSSTAYMEAYWCMRQDKTANHQGFLFGGIYSGAINNPVTQTYGCPIYFYPLRFGTDMKVCVSDDYELGFRYSVPFAGFFSCKAGNPYAIDVDTSTKTNDLRSFIRSDDSYNWPRNCPPGYSMHLAVVEINTCEINYCVQAHAYTFKGFPPIRKPPFIELPTDIFSDGDRSKQVYEISDDRKTWILVTPQAPADLSTKNKSARAMFSVLILNQMLFIVVAIRSVAV